LGTILSAGLTDVGQRRPHNEDFFACDDALGLYIVADGVGGRAKGEVASQEAVEQVQMWVRRHLADLEKDLANGAEGRAHIRRTLESGVQSACYMVFALGEQDPEQRGMSTTISLLWVRGGYAFVAHVGDSRVYRVRGSQVYQLTEDHTLVNHRVKHGLITAEEAKFASGKNVITRAVGHKDYVQVDTVDVEIVSGDRFFLCTDGFHNYLLDDHELAALFTVDSLERTARNAINLANERGGRDNITALVIAVTTP
jgi:protein phosphatase